MVIGENWVRGFDKPAHWRRWFLLFWAATAIYMLTVVVAMFFNYLGYHSVIVDIFVWASMAITLISSLHYIRHASRIIDAPAN